MSETNSPCLFFLTITRWIVDDGVHYHAQLAVPQIRSKRRGLMNNDFDVSLNYINHAFNSHSFLFPYDSNDSHKHCLPFFDDHLRSWLILYIQPSQHGSIVFSDSIIPLFLELFKISFSQHGPSCRHVVINDNMMTWRLDVSSPSPSSATSFQWHIIESSWYQVTSSTGQEITILKPYNL